MQGVRQQFSKGDRAALLSPMLIDPSRASGHAFTMVLAPDGIIYKEEGEIRLLPLRRVVLAHLPDSGCIGDAASWGNQRV